MVKWVRRSFWAFCLLFFVWVVYVFASAFYWQVHIGGPLERDLGFRYGRARILENGSLSHRMLTIEEAYANGVMHKAGFRRGDIVLNLSGNARYQLLHRNRGGEVTMQVVDGGDGSPVEERPIRTITFHVPVAKNE